MTTSAPVLEQARGVVGSREDTKQRPAPARRPACMSDAVSPTTTRQGSSPSSKQRLQQHVGGGATAGLQVTAELEAACRPFEFVHEGLARGDWKPRSSKATWKTIITTR